MKPRSLSLCGLALLGVLLALPRQASPQDTAKGGTLKVKANYTGSGTVDEKHKIYVVLWDSPDFVQGGAMPVQISSTTAKDGVVTFSNVAKVPAYISSAFDPKGEWDGQSGPPPSGTSLGSTPRRLPSLSQSTCRPARP